MKDEFKNKISDMPAEKLFLTYMHLISKCESEEVYRLIEPVGEGIMKHNHIAKGIELVYSELESYNPNYQAEKKEVDAIEIMYIVDGHGDFELQNRQFVSGDKGDVLIFNSKSAVKKCSLGKSGMNCLSLIIFTREALKFLNDFLSTKDFVEDDFFSEIRSGNFVVTYPADDLLEKLFLEMTRLPEKYSTFKLKLAVTHALLLMMERKDKRDTTDLYFSGTTGRKVQNVRRLINLNIEKENSIEELARKVNLNRTTLQKVFKEMYGLTINEYRTKARLQLAKNLLASTELSITEIAGRCGYANASKFSDVFKKNEGLLPKDWRK